MTSAPDAVVDVAIFGGGIAGLWLLDRLRSEGFSAVLFEAEALGLGQSVAAQGIIHGGAKYTFGLMRDSAVKELREMPAVWRDSLQGRRGPDLSGAAILSPCTYMWLPKQVGGGLLGAFSRLVMRSHVRSLPRSDWPEGLDAPGVAGSVYALDELVVNVPTVLAALHDTHRDHIRKIPDSAAVSFERSSGSSAAGQTIVKIGDVSIASQRFVLTAGAGNEGLLAAAGLEGIEFQRRPLQQVLVAGMKQPLYAHCVGKSTKPIATVTAHPSSQGDYVWNVGGGLAEDGARESPEQLVDRARRELPRAFPAADFSGARWAAFRVDRAEGAMPGGARPGAPVVRSRDDFIVAWPTKLALAPSLSDRVVTLLRSEGIRPAGDGESACDALRSLPEPRVAPPPWERVEAWS